MLPEIELGSLTLQTFGICFALGFLASGALIARRLDELGKSVDWAYEIAFAALIGGLVGARLNYLLENYDSSDGVFGNAFSGSGLVWIGGVFGGAAAMADMLLSFQCPGVRGQGSGVRSQFATLPDCHITRTPLPAP